jgi:hypothetical protein
MKSKIAWLAAVPAVVLAAPNALAQDYGWTTPDTSDTPPAPTAAPAQPTGQPTGSKAPSATKAAHAQTGQAQPNATSKTTPVEQQAAPTGPSADDDSAPPPPDTSDSDATDDVAASGQWVNTTDNGWIWVPAGTTSYSIDGIPTAYFYTPSYGWSWYAAPWGAGPFVYGAWAGRPWPHGFRAWARGPYGWGWRTGIGFGHGYVGYGHAGWHFRGGFWGHDGVWHAGRGWDGWRSGRGWYGGGHGAWRGGAHVSGHVGASVHVRGHVGGAVHVRAGHGAGAAHGGGHGGRR